METNHFDPIRDYWQPFSGVRSLGSFDSISAIGNDDYRGNTGMDGIRKNNWVSGVDGIQRNNLVSDVQGVENWGTHPLNSSSSDMYNGTYMENRQFMAQRDAMEHQKTPVAGPQPNDKNNDASTKQTRDDDTYTLVSDEGSRVQQKTCSLICGDFDFSIKGFPGCC